MPVIFDTDIGSNIDDALCLAYLLRQPACELLGVTTVTGQPDVRASLASAICIAAGRDDIPICAGASEPLLGPQAQSDVPQAELLTRYRHGRDFRPNRAVDFLRETVRQRAGQVVLLTTGPLTNAALAFALDRELPQLLGRHVMMGGVYSTRRAGVGPVERNIRNDPVAAAIVFDARPRGLCCIGQDVTIDCQIPVAAWPARTSDPLLELLAEMVLRWSRCRDRIVFNDPLAAAVVFEPGLCSFATGWVEVEQKSDRVAGMTHFRPDAAGPHRIACDVHADRFLRHYFGVLGLDPPEFTRTNG